MEFKDLTIAFSGHNIKEFAIVAIESFLLLYPDMRGNVVYFDDESTDGTATELESRGIRVITWSDKLRQVYSNLFENNVFKSGVHALVVRCDFIAKEILRQCETKFLLINDGDVVFLHGGFLEEYFSRISSNDLGIVTLGKCNYYTYGTPQDTNRYYKKFSKNICTDGYFKRVYLLHSLLNIDKIPLNDLLTNLHDLDYINCMNGVFADVGSDLLYLSQELNLHYEVLYTEDINSVLLHWDWVSSACRDSLRDCTCSNRDYRELFTQQLKTFPELRCILREIGVSLFTLIKSIEYKVGKSSYN